MAAQREWFEKDYYEILGVPETATAKEITKAYRKLARELHPDKNPGDAEAEERFKAVSAAYDVLGDETKRAEYDEVRRLGPMGGPGGRARRLHVQHGRRQRQRPRRPARADVRPARRSSGGGAASGAGPRRGADVAGRADARLRRRGARHDHDAAPHERRPVLDVPRLGRPPGHDAQAVPAVRWPRRHRRQPGPVLVLHAVPPLRRRGHRDRGPVPDVPGQRRREAGPRGAGPHPGRRVRRPDDPAQGPRRARPQRRPGRRPARADPRRPAPAVRPQRQRPHGPGAGHASPRPRSAPTSPCRRSTARRSRCGSSPARSRAAGTACRARASRPRRAPAT